MLVAVGVVVASAELVGMGVLVAVGVVVASAEFVGMGVLVGVGVELVVSAAIDVV